MLDSLKKCCTFNFRSQLLKMSRTQWEKETWYDLITFMLFTFFYPCPLNLWHHYISLEVFQLFPICLDFHSLEIFFFLFFYPSWKLIDWRRKIKNELWWIYISNLGEILSQSKFISSWKRMFKTCRFLIYVLTTSTLNSFIQIFTR